MIKEKGLYAYMDALLNFIFPRNINCIICGEAIETTEKYSLCSHCRKTVPFISRRECEICGKPLESLYLPKRCPDCITMAHKYTKGYSCVEYNEEMKQLVYKLKYGKQRYLSYHFAEMMVEKLKREALENIDIIVPVPLHKKRLRQRGFNQSELMAKYIGKAMDWPVDVKNLVRVRNTETQNQLSKIDRKKNLSNAFEVVSTETYRGKKILLVDDVYTTGSTVDACSLELKKSNPKAIYVITLATGKNVEGS